MRENVHCMRVRWEREDSDLGYEEGDARLIRIVGFELKDATFNRSLYLLIAQPLDRKAGTHITVSRKFDISPVVPTNPPGGNDIEALVGIKMWQGCRC